MQATPTSPGQQSAPSQPAQGGGGAEQAIQMIQKGFETLSKMIESAGQQIDPDDLKLFQVAVKAADNFIQAITSPEQDEAQEQAPQKGQPSGPMPQNANAGAKPAPQY